MVMWLGSNVELFVSEGMDVCSRISLHISSLEFILNFYIQWAFIISSLFLETGNLSTIVMLES